MTISGLVRRVSATVSESANGVVYRNVLIPKTSGQGYHPHKVNFLVPNGPLVRSLIILHGGDGTNVDILRQLRMVAADENGYFADNAVAWWILKGFGGVVVATPQGWTDPLTVTSKDPSGVASWTNYLMNSRAPAAGWDDVTFLKDLRLYMTSAFGTAAVALAGHSNGGMMVNRMLIEAPTLFSHFISDSGPLPGYWADKSPTFPNKPYKCVYSAKDSVLNISNSGGFYADTWFQTYATLVPSDDNYPNLSTYVGDWSTVAARAAALGISSTSINDAVVSSVVSGTESVWTYGKLSVTLLSEGEHKIIEKDNATGRRTIIDWLKWIQNT